MSDTDVPTGWTAVATQMLGTRVVGMFRTDTASLALSDGAGNALPCGPVGHLELGVGEDVTILGGLMPEAAVSVDVAAGFDYQRVPTVIQGGVWCALLREPSFSTRLRVPVLYKDTDGRVIPEPLPAGLTGRPVLDSSEHCPACGGQAWEQLEDDGTQPFDDHSLLAGAAVWVACSFCGHSERGGVGRLPPPAVRHGEWGVSEVPLNALTAIGYPIYRTLGGRARVQAIMRSRGQAQRVDVECIVGNGAKVSVRTGPTPRPRNPLFAARAWTVVDAMMGAQASPLRDDSHRPTDLRGQSDAAFLIASRARRRSAARTVAGARSGRSELSVDDEPVQFDCFETPDAWVASRSSGNPQITLAGRGGFHPAALTLVRWKV